MGKGGAGAGGAGMSGGGGGGGRGGGGGGAAGSAVRVCLFDSRRGKREGKRRRSFCSSFRPPLRRPSKWRCWGSGRASSHSPESSPPITTCCWSVSRPGIFMVLVVECRGVSGGVPPDATVRDEALRQYLVEAHALFCLFFGSIDRLLQQQPQPPPPPLPSEATTGPSSNPSSNLESGTPSHDSPSAVPPSADLARACLQAFLPDFLTGGSPEPSAARAFPFALSAITPTGVHFLVDSTCASLFLPHSSPLSPSLRPFSLSLRFHIPTHPSRRVPRAICPRISLRPLSPHTSSSPPASSPRLPIQPPFLSPTESSTLPHSSCSSESASPLLPEPPPLITPTQLPHSSSSPPASSPRLPIQPPLLPCRQLNLPRSLTLPALVRLPSLLDSLSCRQLNLPRSLTLPALSLANRLADAFQGAALLLCHNLLLASTLSP
ncbi:unnamed protein product, partial [Closterium sp. Naga37s-1]